MGDSMPKDEFEWIQQHTPAHSHQKRLEEGIGDDAAVYKASSFFDEVVCVDTMIEGIHFTKETMAPYDIGYKALAANISDLAAMGAEPSFYIVSIAIPPHWEDDDLSGLYKGMAELGDRFEMDLIGGDTVSSAHELMVSITVIGRVETGRRLLRRNAEPGDIIFLTGPVGRSASGLKLLLEKGRHASFSSIEQTLLSCHQRPEPQVKTGRLAASLSARIALNDISDGLASESFEIAEASGVQMHLEHELVPVPDEFAGYDPSDYWEWMLYGGEDFELLGTVEAGSWEEFQRLSEAAGINVTNIGRVEAGAAGVWLHHHGNAEALEKKGYNHFSGKEGQG